MASIVITEAEILEALACADGAEPDARSLVELTEVTGFGRERITAALRALHKQGRLVVQHVRRPAIDGGMRVVPVYTILPKSAA